MVRCKIITPGTGLWGATSIILNLRAWRDCSAGPKALSSDHPLLYHTRHGATAKRGRRGVYD
jgi:hypothetical protein